MIFEKQINQESNLKEYADKIKNIRTSLENGEGDIMKLDLEFVELWKNIPNEVGDDVHEDIDIIRELLMEKHGKGEY